MQAKSALIKRPGWLAVWSLLHQQASHSLLATQRPQHLLKHLEQLPRLQWHAMEVRHTTKTQMLLTSRKAPRRLMQRTRQVLMPICKPAGRTVLPPRATGALLCT